MTLDRDPGVSRGSTALLIGITPHGSQAILNTSLFIGSRNFTRTSGGDCRHRDFPLFVRWYREGKLKLDELVTRRYALEEINQAADDLEHGRILGRTIITYAIHRIARIEAHLFDSIGCSARPYPRPNPSRCLVHPSTGLLKTLVAGYSKRSRGQAGENRRAKAYLQYVAARRFEPNDA